MEVVFQILEKLPSGWPRVAALIGLGALFFLPEMRRLLMWRVWDKRRFEQAKQLLELRQLQIEVESLKAQHPEATNESLDERIGELFDEVKTQPVLTKPITWTDRLKYSFAGSIAMMVLGTIALWQSGKFVDKNAALVILIELGYAVICGILAAAIPGRHDWEFTFRGFLIPAFLGALAAAAN